jgi:predicted flap endonuclease-1-like 5' DNA nuclease
MIQRVDGCSTAIAASRARDLSQMDGIGEAVEGIARGWEILMMSDLASLTPLQRETIELLVLNIKNNLTDGLIQAGRLER